VRPTVWSPSKAAALRTATRRPSISPAIDLMPFLGVFVVLLIMFMCYPGAFHGDSPVDLPKARSATLQPGAVREDAIRIAVTRNGRRFFGSDKAEPDELPNLIRTAMRAGSERKVYLLADGRVRNEDVEIVVDQIQLAYRRVRISLAALLRWQRC
jgi:biopolymer transport protein TolR